MPQLDTGSRAKRHGDPLFERFDQHVLPFDSSLCSRRACPLWGCPGVEVYDGRLDGCGHPTIRSGCPWATTDARRAFDLAESIRERGYPRSGAIEAAGAVYRPHGELERWQVGTAFVELDAAGVRVKVAAVNDGPDAEAPDPSCARDADDGQPAA